MSVMSVFRRVVPLGALVAAALAGSATPASADPPAYRAEVLPLDRATAISDSGIIAGAVGGQAVLLRGSTITVLPPLPGDVGASVTSVNDNGDATGTSTGADGVQHGVVWRRGVPVSIGSLGGPRTAPASINNRGHVTGFADVPGTPFANAHAFFWDGEMHDLGVLPGQTFSVGSDLNDHDDVVGFSGGHPVIWHADGSVQDLGTMRTPGFAQAFNINERGQVVGVGNSAPTGAPHGFVWDGGFTDLGTIGGPTSSAAGINDGGLVVGQASTAAFRTHAVAWDHGAVIDLHIEAASFTVAARVNNRGDIIGSAFFGSSSSPILWRR